MSVTNGLVSLILLFSVAGLAAPSSKKEFTREILLQGSPVPEKREYPLSQKIGACEDFHQYVCHDVESNFKLPDDRSAWTFSFTDAFERILHAKKNYFRLLGKGYEPKTERAKQLKDYYLACMNPAARKSEEISYVAKEKKQMSEIKDVAALKDLFGSRLTAPEFSLLGVDTLANQDNPAREDLFLMTEIMTLPEKSYYDKPEAVADLRKLALAFFKTLKMDQPEKRADWVTEFEVAFAKTYPTPAEFRQRISARTYRAKEEWLKRYPQLQLEKLFKLVPADIQVRDITPESSLFIAESLDKSPLEQWKSVALFHALKGIMDDAYPAFFKEQFAFRKKHMGGPEKRPARDERCTKDVMNRFDMELDNELIPILFPDFPQDQVVTLAENVRSSILSGIKNNDWLSRDARKEALRKTEKAKLFLVKPQNEVDWNFLPIQKYDAKQPLTNQKKVTQAKIDKMIKEANEPRIPSRWAMGPLDLNAYYSPWDNKFVLLQGILQYPFFDPSQPQYQNTAAIGAVVGHELGHGIDDEGSKYDADGKLRQWMSMKDLGEFSKRGARFVERFDKIGHNGRLTLGENIGDHVGTIFAYDAAFPNKSKATLEEKKGFFISYARMWCQVMRPSFREMRLKTDPHAMAEGRINEQVMQHDAFQEAFACKAGDKMFLEKKDRLRIW